MPDYATAIPLLRQAIRHDDANAMGLFASLLAMGYGIEQNIEEAVLWYRQSAVRGVVPSQVALGYSLASGMGGHLDQREACYWLLKAVRQGNSQAAIGLSKLVMDDPSLLAPPLMSESELNDLLRSAHRAKPPTSILEKA